MRPRRRRDALLASALASALGATATTAFAAPRPSASRVDATRRLGRTPGWLDDAMGAPDDDDDGGAARPDLAPGLAGFSLSEDRDGFYAVLASADAGVAVAVLVSAADRERVASPAAVTLVQLAGGLDLGTAVLPPDALLDLVADELEEDEEEDGDAEERRERLRRSRLSLSAVRAVRNPQADAAGAPAPAAAGAAARNPAVPDALVDQVCAAVAGLPGLGGATRAQVEDAVHRHADERGALDRDGFSHLLETVRRALSPAAGRTPAVAFELTCAVLSGDGAREVALGTADAAAALGLALRHGADVEVAPELAGDAAGGAAFPAARLRERFPAFRPLAELREDAQIMDGFIPTMFAKTRDLDNDDKAQ